MRKIILMLMTTMVILSVSAQPVTTGQKVPLQINKNCCDTLVSPPKSCCPYGQITKSKDLDKVSNSPAQNTASKNKATPGDQRVKVPSKSKTLDQGKPVEIMVPPDCCDSVANCRPGCDAYLREKALRVRN
jgi:hypothetical protein